MQPTLADIHAAAHVIRGVADGTPLVPSPVMARAGGQDFLLKLENMQPIGAFKLRGALNAVAHLGDAAGVTCCSTGNHGRGVAYAARQRGLRAVICVSELVPQARFVDATALVNWQRLVKSDEEIAFIRNAARISDKVVETAIDRAAPGVRKNDLVADILHAGITGVDGIWGDYPAIVPLTPSGLDATAAHLTWNGNPMREGEATFFELSGCYRRYHAPLCRTVFLGTPPREMLEAEKAQLEGIAAGLEAARAGNRTCDIANAFIGVLESHGIRREGRCGYPIGLSYPPDWGERTASIRPEDETVLQPGMTFHFMPALWMESWGLETTETILIKEDGPAEALCDVARKLVVKT
jgi:ectoine hydrolase